MATYRDAGVDIEQGDSFVKRIAPLVRSTFRPEVMGDLGGFGGLFQFPSERYKEPVLVSGTDGVGTKVKIAQRMGRHDTIGIDLVAMCVNDILVSGAEPLFFLDYFGTGQLDPETGEAIVKGIVEGCRQAECALIGGETAEMPSCYPVGEYDLAGFAVGVVERSAMLGKDRVKDGDVLIGVDSSGLHSNGYSLARQVLLEQQAWTLDRQVEELGGSLGDALLKPTNIYVKLGKALLKKGGIHSFVHVTGGGLTGNVPRVLPETCGVRIDRKSWEVPALFRVIQEAGAVEQEEMFRVFNMGIGFVVLTEANNADMVLQTVRSEGMEGRMIGQVVSDSSRTEKVTYTN